MSKPLVSVIIPAYNCAKYIEKCVETIENQTYNNIEIIICDDCSTDNTREILMDLESKYSNIKILHNKTNLKAAATRNKCIKNANGNFIAIQDADDYSDQCRIEVQVDFLMRNPDIDYVSSSAIIFDENGKKGERMFDDKILTDKDFYKSLPLMHGSTLFKKTALIKVGGYRIDKSTVRGQDADMFYRMQIAKIKGATTSDILYYYNEDDSAFRRRKYKYRIYAYKMRKMYFKQMDLNFFERLYRFKPLIVGLIPKSWHKKYRKIKESNILKVNDNEKKQITKKIKVAQVIKKMDIGGIETFLINVCRNIDTSRIQMDFIFFDEQPGFYDSEIIRLGCNIHYVPRNKGIFFHMLALKDKFREEKYDVVHVHSLWYNGIVMLAAYLAKVKIRISHSHNTADSKNNNFIRKLYRNTSKIMINAFSNRYCACGIEAGKYLYYNRNQSKVIILKNGIDVNKFKFNNDNKIKQELNLRDDEIILGNISRIEAVKNHEFLIQIAKELVNRNVKFKMIFVGDGSLFEIVKQNIQSERLSDFIILTGKRTDIPEILSCIDIFLLPSKYEGFPFVVVEAQAAGVPMILTNNIDKSTSINKELVNYIDIEKTDVNLWCDKIESLSKKTNTNRLKNIEPIINKGYDINTTVVKLTDIYLNK